MDKKIREKLEGLSPELDASSWEQLAERMDRMDDNAWDDRIKEHLESAAVSGAALSSWEALSNKLDVAEDRVFDQQMEEKLENVQGGAALGWSTLEEKWMAWQKMRKDFIALRTIEVIAILLLIFSLHQWGSIWKKSLWDGSVANQEEMVDEATSTNLLSAELRSEEVNDKEFDLEDENVRTEHNETLNAVAEYSGYNGTDQVTRKSSGNKILNKGIVNSVVRATIISENSTKTTEEDGASLTATRSEDAQAVEQTPRLLYSSDLMPIASAGLTGMQNESLSPFRKSWYLATAESSRAPIWLSLYTTLGYNQVDRPAVDTFESAMYTQPYIGGGVQFSFENGRWHLSSGIEYHQTRVTSGRTLAHVDRSGAITFVTLNDARIKFFTLPILINYSIIQNKRHQLYALAGARLHISSGINYNFSFDYGPGATGSEPIDEMGIHGVSDVNFTYFTINGGLGYQHMINDRLGLFGSAGVELFGQNNSLFPNGEKINVIRLDAGLRVRL